MSYQRKTRDVWNLLGDYGQGFEHVTAELTYKEIRERLREYRATEPHVPFRVKMTRERIDELLPGRPQIIRAHTLAHAIGEACNHEMREITNCVICGKRLDAGRQHVDTCSKACMRKLIAMQSARNERS